MESLPQENQVSETIAVIAGNGVLPIAFAQCARQEGLNVLGIALGGECDSDLESEVDFFEQVKIGKLGALLKILEKYKVERLAFAGGVKKIKIFQDVAFDLKALNLLARTRSLKDDILLREVAKEIERSGVEVIAADLFLKHLLPQEEFLTSRNPSKQEQEDIELGIEAAKGIGKLDIGQSVVVYKGVVVAVEAVDGTDATILRGGEVAGTNLNQKALKHGAVLVKFAKPQQDLRFDLPSIGVKTIENCVKAGITAICLEREKSLMLDKEEMLALADASSISIISR